MITALELTAKLIRHACLDLTGQVVKRGKVLVVMRKLIEGVVQFGNSLSFVIIMWKVFVLITHCEHPLAIVVRYCNHF